MHTLAVIVLCLAQCVVEVGDQIVDGFEANRQSNEVIGHARRELLLHGKLGVRGAGGVNRQRLGVADVGKVLEQLEAVDKRTSSRTSTLDAEADQTALSLRQIFLGEFVRRVIRQAGVVDPFYLGMFL